MSKWIDERIARAALAAEVTLTGKAMDEYRDMLEFVKKAEEALIEIVDDDGLVHYSGGWALQSQAREALASIKNIKNKYKDITCN